LGPCIWYIAFNKNHRQERLSSTHSFAMPWTSLHLLPHATFPFLYRYWRALLLHTHSCYFSITHDGIGRRITVQLQLIIYIIINWI
jgi:hypothetical protein